MLRSRLREGPKQEQYKSPFLLGLCRKHFHYRYLRRLTKTYPGIKLRAEFMSIFPLYYSAETWGSHKPFVIFAIAVILISPCLQFLGRGLSHPPSLPLSLNPFLSTLLSQNNFVSSIVIVCSSPWFCFRKSRYLSMVNPPLLLGLLVRSFFASCFKFVLGT